MTYETYTERQARIEARQEKAPHIPAPTGGVVVDQQLRDAVNAVRQLLVDEKIMKAAG